MKYGYARCSTNENQQDIQRQIRELRAMGIEKGNIYFEYESGAKRERTELNLLFQVVKSGDWIISTEVSRITRSTKQLCEIIDFAKEKSLCLTFGSFNVDCRNALDPMTEGMLKMMGVFSELERNIISERVKSGLKNAEAKGKHIGRRKTTENDIPSVFFKYYPKYIKGAVNKKELSRLCGLSYPTVYKYLNVLENSGTV